MMRLLRRKTAQAMTEMALTLPILIYLTLGAADLGRAFYLNVEVAGASRAGMRMGVTDSNMDVGAMIRSEPNSAIPNTAAAWGNEASGGSRGACTGTSQACGATGGCAPTDFITGQIACFAVRSGTYVATSGCSFTGSAWGTRPTTGSDSCLGVRVVYKLVPVTPMIATFTGGKGAFYLAVDTDGLELY